MNKNFNKFSYNLDDNGHVIRNCEPHHINTADSTPVNIFTGPCLVGYVNGWNNDSTNAGFIKFYDTVSAPVVGTDAPVFSLGVGPKSSHSISFSNCISLTKGLWVAAVAGNLDSSSVSPSTALNVDLGIIY